MIFENPVSKCINCIHYNTRSHKKYSRYLKRLSEDKKSNYIYRCPGLIQIHSEVFQVYAHPLHLVFIFPSRQTAQNYPSVLHCPAHQPAPLNATDRSLSLKAL